MSTSTLDNTTAAATSSSGGSSMNILSDKVQRALQVRTDTPAMKAALEALGQLDNGSINTLGKPSHNDNKNTSSSHHHNMMVPLDARSVRHAIEYDALQQALLLQDNLSSLVTTIRELREGISDVATLAHNVQQAISSNVVTETTRTSMISTTSTTTTTAAAAGGTDGSDTMAAADQQQQLQQQQYQNQQAEERLAATIAEAFQRRNVARHRLQAITTFLETFDLSEKDSRLLDHYNFEDMHSTTNMQMHSQHQHPNSSSDSAAAAAAAAPNGMAFLRALERVWQIRRALVKTFGSGHGGMGGNNNAFMMETSRSFEDGEKSSGGGGLGASSALRMMESLAQKQEHAYERLYRTFDY
jgi:conserved oligomeric Golgi complex subunit 6